MQLELLFNKVFFVRGILMENKINLQVNINNKVNYAMYHNKFNIIRNINLKNISDEKIEKIILKIISDCDAVEPFSKIIEHIEPLQEIKLNDVDLKINGDYLATLTEKINCNLKITVEVDGEILVSRYEELTILSFDEWAGMGVYPEILASFVTPNHPIMNQLKHEVAKILGSWNVDASLDGYLSQNSDRVKKMAGAAFVAIQKLNIVYSVLKSSYENEGQRIRLCEDIYENRLANCIDITLLYCSLIESLGLNPIIILSRGHAYAGVWLVDQSFQENILDDSYDIERRTEEGINEIIVVECTNMCSGNLISFDEAIGSAKNTLAKHSEFLLAIDVVRNRKAGVLPLPSIIKVDGNYKVKHEEISDKEVSQPQDVGYILDLDKIDRNKNITKQMQWERKLLDLSMRNMLINMRMTRSVVPIIVSNIYELEDSLSSLGEFQITYCNQSVDTTKIDPESINEFESKDIVEYELKRKRIMSIYSKKDLDQILTKIYRSTKISLEENGASTLYIAVGLLKWYEKKGINTPPRYAPILLIPLEIIRKSAKSGYSVVSKIEEAQINVTILEFLKQNYDIEVEGLSDMPYDEYGIDVKKIFAIIRHHIKGYSNWKVVESAFIANFSFSQFIMWNDIKNKEDFLEKNNVVRSLVKGYVDWDSTIPIDIEQDEVYLPITADSSQIRAVKMAANDVSFVLHGPPGTGKSQTITAIISNALIKGKTVLFVAEKMAALEVVEKRLNKLGIGDFCMELHSNKSSKKSVLSQLKKALESSENIKRVDYENKSTSLEISREEIDDYARALHEKRTCGKSVRELIDLYEAVPDHEEKIIFSPYVVGSLTQIGIEEQKKLLERLISAARAVGHPANHPLAAVVQTEYSQTLKFELENCVSEYLSNLKLYGERGVEIANNFAFKPMKKNDWEYLDSLIKNILDIADEPEFLVYADNVEQEFLMPLNYFQKKQQLEDRRKFLLNSWDENFLKIDMSIYINKYEEAKRKFFGKTRAINNVVDAVRAYYKGNNFEQDRLFFSLSEIESFQKEEKSVEKLFFELKSDSQNLVNKFNSYEDFKKYKEDIFRKIENITDVKNILKNLKQSGNYNEFLSNSKEFISITEKLNKSYEKLQNLLAVSIDKYADDWVDKTEKTYKMILENEEKLKDWITYKKYDEDLRKMGAEPICDAYVRGLEHEKVMDVYLKSIYKYIIINNIEKEPTLNKFTGTVFNEQIEQFKKLDEECINITKSEIYNRLKNNLPDEKEGPEISKELNVLRRAISSNGRGISIRTLFEEIPQILKRLTPCMLMSPISVAQYLSEKSELFDLVVFDEASQLPTCKAVGVLARGKNAVIVGDPNQMPPTSFFAGNSIDEDNLEIEDLDSILDDCLALGVPQTYLKWHYRSKHESLISFSNTEFYENAMLTFPSKNDREKRVSMTKVNGIFERGKGRVNRIEAEAIVEEIKKIYNDEKLNKKSVGVITFNITQQTLIEDLLNLEFKKNEKFDFWANSGEETLFVKNLENVQGDERDIILFSIAFARDEYGKMSMNFGPINKDGGWKRLNVAVSRARYEMKVFSSIDAEDIDMRRTKSRGVEALRNFLEFARSGRLQQFYKKINSEDEKGITKSICKMLEQNGYEYQLNVGHSDFKVDIGIINTYNQSEYLLGIMFDGDSYKKLKNTKDREISQLGVLKNLEWNLYRVWSMDWWDNKEKVLEEILRVLDENKKIAEEKNLEKIKENTKNISENFEMEKEHEEILENKKYSIENYVSASLDFSPMSSSQYTKAENRELIIQKVNAILEKEAPISEDRFLKKLLRSFGILKNSKQVIEFTEKILENLDFKIIEEGGVKFYWKDEQQLETFKIFRIENENDARTIDEIPRQELKNLVCHIIQLKNTDDREVILREAQNIMSYKKITPKFSKNIEMGIEYGKETGEIK